MTRYVVAGGICGLAWAASLRGWMAELANGSPGNGSEVTWLTLVLVLLPGTVVGALHGYAAHRHATERPVQQWLVLTPLVLASALLDPAIFRALLRDGTGSGSLIVVLTASAVGAALSPSRTGRTWTRVLLAVVAALGLLTMLGMGGLAAPLSSPRGLWVALFGFALVLLFGVAGVVLRRPRPSPIRARGWIAFGALAGFSWAAGLRAFMAQVMVRDGSTTTWAGTFLWVLAPGVVMGCLLGWSAYRWWHGGPDRMRWLVLSPFLFTAVLVPPLVTFDVGEMFEGGTGGGTIGVPAVALAGAYAVAGRRLWWRAAAGALVLSAIPIWVATSVDIGGPELAVGTPRGLWVALTYWSLLTVLALASATALRITPGGARPVRHPAASRQQRGVAGSMGPTSEEHAW